MASANAMREHTHTRTHSTAGVVVVLCSTAVFSPQEITKKNWRQIGKLRVEGGEDILISAR